MSCQQVPTAPAFNPYPRSVQVGEFEVAIGGGIWVAIRAAASASEGKGLISRYCKMPVVMLRLTSAWTGKFQPN